MLAGSSGFHFHAEEQMRKMVEIENYFENKNLYLFLVAESIHSHFLELIGIG